MASSPYSRLLTLHGASAALADGLRHHHATVPPVRRVSNALRRWPPLLLDNEPSPRLRDNSLVAPTSDVSLAASPHCANRQDSLSSPTESDYGWLYATTLFDTITVVVRSMITVHE
ncbi:hypothetical protein K438DRAFT_1954229 [Mycena galopus ATCC 62051]|nr:hypothetical protein K438DRAFT_1954229 [Mycena galopus ATCC 62051]